MGKAVQLRDVSLAYLGYDNEEILFTATDIILQPGRNTVTAECPVSVVGSMLCLVLTDQTTTQGLFTLHETRLSLGQIAFGYPAEAGASPLKLRRSPAAPSTILRMPSDSGSS
jgi:hypothetical protein